jgi:uncharacterized protein YgiM (DUF1202 family)
MLGRDDSHLFGVDMMRRTLLGAVAAVAMLVTGAALAAEVSQTAPATAGRTELAQASQQSQARVRVKSAVLRARPDAKSRKLGSLRRGTRLQVLESAGDWTHVRVRGHDGYVLNSLLTM